jgi:ribonucleoside-diphosphate reductase alpha chain
MNYQGIEIDAQYDSNLNEQAYSLLKDYYMLEGETTPQMSYARAALAFCQNDLQLAQRIYEYAAKNWFMFSSPILSNAKTADGQNSKGLPISCFLSYVDDSLEGLMDHSNELRWMSVKGGGVGGHWSTVRANSEISPGPIPFLKTVDADMTAYRQGKTRKGSYAAYIDISHPDVVEFLNIRVPTGGDSHRKCFNLNNAINITDDFMQAVIDDRDWQLIDPKTKGVRDTIGARDLWQRILEVRFRTGEPYLNFIDEANRKLPQYQQEKGLKIHGSNLCITGDSLLTVMIDNQIKEMNIKDVIAEFEENKDIYVLSYNIDKKVNEFQKVLEGQLMSESAELLEIEDDETGFKLICTPEHLIFTKNRGYVMAKDLTEQDELLINSNKD